VEVAMALQVADLFRTARVLGVLAVLVILASGAFLYAAHNAGRAELRAMCERDFKPKVYRKASAEGYFDSGISCIEDGCWEVLTRSPFKFMEFENRNLISRDVLKEPGFYRVTQVRQDSGRCDSKVFEDLKQRHASKDYVASGNCLQVEKLAQPEAHYGLYSEMLKPVHLNNWFGSVIKIDHSFIRDLATGEMVVEQLSPMLFQSSIPSFSSFAPMLHCRSRGINDGVDYPHVTAVRYYLKPD
jgi:hypothetical protein